MKNNSSLFSRLSSVVRWNDAGIRLKNKLKTFNGTDVRLLKLFRCASHFRIQKTYNCDARVHRKQFSFLGLILLRCLAEYSVVLELRSPLLQSGIEIFSKVHTWLLAAVAQFVYQQTIVTITYRDQTFQKHNLYSHHNNINIYTMPTVT